MKIEMPVFLAVLVGSILAVAGQSADSTERRAFGGIQPALSPDGRMIALSFQGAICRMPAEGGTLTRLTRGEGWDVEPTWSLDGKQIAFINAPGFFTGQVAIIAAEDGAVRALPQSIVGRGRLQFHPDGKRLISFFARSGQPDRLYWFHLETGELLPIDVSSIEPYQRASMKWALSPDGLTLLLVTYQDRPGEQGGNNGPAADLWRVSSAGGEPQKVTRWRSRIYNLCWDAEGTGAFVTTDRGVAYNDIWHVPLKDPLERARKITSDQADEDWPSVSADGRWLLHAENSERATALVRVDLKSGERQTLNIDRVDFREATGKLRLEIKDAQSAEPLVARVSVKQIGGKFHFPLGALYRFTGGFGHFYARHNAELTLPAGKYAVHIWRGPEYLVHKEEIEVVAGQTLDHTVSLKRWINMPERGWFSGENHVHANYGYGAWHNDQSTIRDQCEGEDLHVANVVVANSDGDGVFDRQYFTGQVDPISGPRTIIFWNEEFRSTIWGHLTLGNLSQLVEPVFTGFKETTNPWDVPTNADIAERTRTQRGTVSYTHPASSTNAPYDGPYAGKGMPVDIALGRVDTLDVMGFGYEASWRVWYRLLNCGFRIPAAAGTDVFLNRIASFPPGWGRCYVRLKDGLSYTNWMGGQKAGRSFITTGPMLEWTANNLEPGDTLRLQGPQKVRVRARVVSQFQLRSLELIVNGNVVPISPATGATNELMLDQEITLNSAGWLTVRCASGNSAGWAPSFGAHGNPIYVEMPGRPLDAQADAKFFLDWIDRLEADLKKRDRVPRGWEGVNLQLDHARATYRRIAGQ